MMATDSWDTQPPLSGNSAAVVVMANGTGPRDDSLPLLLLSPLAGRSGDFVSVVKTISRLQLSKEPICTLRGPNDAIGAGSDCRALVMAGETTMGGATAGAATVAPAATNEAAKTGAAPPAGTWASTGSETRGCAGTAEPGGTGLDAVTVAPGAEAATVMTGAADVVTNDLGTAP